MSRAFRVGVLVSGNGTNLQALLDTVHRRDAIEVAAVAASAPGIRALERASTAKVESAVFAATDFADRRARDEALVGWLSAREIDLVVLAGWMELLSAAFLRRFPEAVVNVHPALLPAFPGLRAVEQALAYGVKISGVTVHFVDEGVDTGPIILQRAVELTGAHDSEQALERLHPVEHELLPEAVRLIARGAVRRDPAHPRRVLVGS